MGTGHSKLGQENKNKFNVPVFSVCCVLSVSVLCVLLAKLPQIKLMTMMMMMA